MELPCYEESTVEEQIVPVYMDHPSEDSNEGVNKDWSILGDCLEENIPFTKENDARMEDDGIVKEEIIPVHLQHKEVDGVETTELPCNEESAVEEQIVPESAVEEQLVLMDSPRPPKPIFMDAPNE